MRRFLILLILTLVLATVGCSPGGRPPGIARQMQPAAGETVVQAEAPAEAPPAAARNGSMPAPALVLIGLAVGAALMIALVSNTAMMPDTAP